MLYGTLQGKNPDFGLISEKIHKTVTVAQGCRREREEKTGERPLSRKVAYPRHGRAARLKTCTYMQVGRLRTGSWLPTSRHLRRGPGGLPSAARAWRPI